MGRYVDKDNWEEEILIPDTHTPILGGQPVWEGDRLIDGFANVSAAVLADRTRHLKNKIDGIEIGLDSNFANFMKKDDNLSDLEDIQQAKYNLELNLVDNTRDLDKPISNATQEALDEKVDLTDPRLSDSRTPKGPAGGVLSGSYPNPTFAVDMATQAELDAVAATKVDNSDARLTNAREWTASVVSQAEAEAGTATTRRAWTAQRVRQAIVAWWNGATSAWGRGLVSSADAGAGRTALGLGTAATRDVGTGSGNVMQVGAGGWVSRAAIDSYISGYPQTIGQSISQIYRRESVDNGVTPYAASIHFAATDTWGRVRVGSFTPEAWIQGGVAGSGAGWTAELIHTLNTLHTTGQSTQYPMTQKATTDALNLKANTSTQVIAGTGLSGGGNLTANRTLSVNFGTTAGTVKEGNWTPSVATKAQVLSGSASDYVTGSSYVNTIAWNTTSHSSGTVTLNLNTSLNHILNITGDVTIGAPSNATLGKTGDIVLRVNASVVVGWDAQWKFLGSVPDIGANGEVWVVSYKVLSATEMLASASKVV